MNKDQSQKPNTRDQIRGNRKPRLLTHASLLLTDSCNLACAYCYRQDTDKGRFMGTDQGKNAVDFLFANSGSRLSMNFFGGEPLLAFNDMREIIEYTLEQAHDKEKKVTFSVNTNGIAFNREIMDLLRKHRVGIILSLDGPPNIHDLHRRTLTGGGCFHLIEKNLPLLLEKPRQVHVRMTVTPDTVGSLYESFRFIHDLGFHSAAAAINRTDIRWNKESMQILQEQYRKVMMWYLDLLRNDSPFQLVDLDFGAASFDYPLHGTGHSCSAGLNGIAISVDGRIYPCYRFAGMEGTEIGDINNGFHERAREIFLQQTSNGMTKCRDCPLNFRCHRCPWLSYVSSGTYNIPVEINCLEGGVMLTLFRQLRDILETERIPAYERRKTAITKQFFKKTTFPETQS